MAQSPVFSFDAPVGPQDRVFGFGPYRRGSLLNRIVFYFAPTAALTEATITYTIRLFDNLPNDLTFDDGVRVTDAFTVPVLGQFISFDIPLFNPIFDKRIIGVRIATSVANAPVTVGTAVYVLPPQNEKRVS